MSQVKFSQLSNYSDKQIEATRAADKARFFLFGGARGPGKSYWIRWYNVRFQLKAADMGLRGVRTMIACEDYPSLRERQISKIKLEFPDWLGYWHGSESEFRLRPQYGGGVIACRNLDDPSKYQSSEFALISIDELTKNPERVLTILMGSMRWPGITRTQFVAATNPNGPGAPWVRRLWVEREFPKHLKGLTGEFAFLPASPRDNPHLDEGYWGMLDALPPTLRAAWRDGDWYAGVEGLVYSSFGAENVVQQEPDPDKPIELAFDDGYVDPRAILFIQRTGSGILVFDELYQRQTLAENSVQDVLDKCERNNWPRPEIAVGSPEAKELQARFRKADIPVRWRAHKVVQGINLVRGLICDGNGYRVVKVHGRCRNFIDELTEGYQYPEGKRGDHEKPIDGNDHACDAFRYWAWVRAN